MAEGITSTAAPAPTKTLEELSPKELEQFMLDGQPVPKEAPAGATDSAEQAGEAAAPQPVEQAASTDATSKAATEAAAPGKVKPAGQKKSAGERADEIAREADAAEERLRKELARRRAANDRLAALERESEAEPKHAAPREPASPAKAPAQTDRADAPLKRPKIDDFKTLDEWEGAMLDYADQKAAQAVKDAEARFNELYDTRSRQDQELISREQAFVEKATKASERMDAELQADPEIIDRIPEQWRRMNPMDRLADGEAVTFAHFVKDHVSFESDHPLALSERLCAGNFAELRRLSAIRTATGAPDIPRVIRELAIMDASMAQTGDTDTGSAADVRPHPRKSNAPAPVQGLPGKKAAAGVDPLKQAIAENDFETFNRLESERTRASR